MECIKCNNVTENEITSYEKVSNNTRKITDKISDKIEFSIRLSDDDYKNIKVVKVENNNKIDNKGYTGKTQSAQTRHSNFTKTTNLIAEYIKTKFRNVKERVNKCLNKIPFFFKGRKRPMTDSIPRKNIKIYIYLPWIKNNQDSAYESTHVENSKRCINTNCIMVSLEGIENKTPISFIITLNNSTENNKTTECETDINLVGEDIESTEKEANEPCKDPPTILTQEKQDIVKRTLCNHCQFEISNIANYGTNSYNNGRRITNVTKHEVVAKEWQIEEIDDNNKDYKVECNTNRYESCSHSEPSICTTKREISHNTSLQRYLKTQYNLQNREQCYTSFIPILDFPLRNTESILNTSRSFEILSREINRNANTDQKSTSIIDNENTNWYNQPRKYNAITEKFSEEQPQLGYFHPLFVLHGPVIIEGKDSILVVSPFEEIYFEAPNFLFVPTKIYPGNMEYVVSGPCIINRVPKGIATSIDGQVAYFDLPIFPSHYWYYEFETPREKLKFDQNGLAVGFANVQISNLLSYNGTQSVASEHLREILNNFNQLPISDQNCLKNIIGSQELEPFVAVDIPIKYANALRMTELDCTIHPHYLKQVYITVPLEALISNGFDPENLDLNNTEFIEFVTNHGIVRKKTRLNSPVYNLSPLLYRLEMQIHNEDLINNEKMPLAHFKFIPTLRPPNSTIGISNIDEIIENKGEEGYVRIPHFRELFKGKYDDLPPCIDLNDSDYNPGNVGDSILYEQNIGTGCMCGTLGRTCPYMSILRPTDFIDPSSFLKVYGDPLCEPTTECSSNIGSVKQTDSLNPENEWTAPIVGRNGNWRCYDCGNVNFPRRTKCNKCSNRRPTDGDKIVLQYVIRVHSELVRRIIESKQRSRNNNPRHTGQLSIPLNSPRHYNRTGWFRGLSLDKVHRIDK